MTRLLLISSSTVHATGYLDHAEAQIRAIVGAARRVLFVPYALFDQGEYAAKARTRFAQMGLAIDSIHESTAPRRAVESSEAIFIGGGNTFRLLKALQERDLMAPIRARVLGGSPYIGSSAGSNLACPTIQTTNDMPIVEPRSFEALHLVSFQINPHYLDADPSSRQMAETREERIRQFHQENEAPVIGLREGAMLRLEDGGVELLGLAGARVFRRGRDPQEFAPGSAIDLSS
jgi:dipeptidase E